MTYTDGIVLGLGLFTATIISIIITLGILMLIANVKPWIDKKLAKIKEYMSWGGYF